MTRMKLLCVAPLLLTTITYSTFAQQPCKPPVPLPNPTEPNIFSEEQEIYLGDAVAEHIQRNYKVIEDAELTDYLTAIGNRLTKHLPLNRLRFQFFLVDLPDANAFVIPGGRIYVSRKLVAAAHSEDELAGVIAHELGHLVAHQSAIDTTRTFKEVLGVTAVSDLRDIFAGYHGRLQLARTLVGDVSEVIDTTAMTKISVPDWIKRLIVGGFTFVGNDRMAGINRENFKKSAVVKFPSGEVLAEM